MLEVASDGERPCFIAGVELFFQIDTDDLDFGSQISGKLKIASAACIEQPCARKDVLLNQILILPAAEPSTGIIPIKEFVTFLSIFDLKHRYPSTDWYQSNFAANTAGDPSHG